MLPLVFPMNYTEQRIHRTLSRLVYQFTLRHPDLRETRRLIEVLMERYLELEDAPAERPFAAAIREFNKRAQAGDDGGPLPLTRSRASVRPRSARRSV
jgi:hypothetical protein